MGSHEEDEAELLKLAEEDITWYDAEGNRYEAMLVLPDGTAFGQKSPSPDQIVPDEENRYGAWEGEDAHSSSSSQSSGISSDEIADGMALLEAIAAAEAPNADQNDPDLPPPTKIVLPTDNRQRITSLLTSFARRTIGSLNQTSDPGFTGCTGTKVGPRAVLTAAHCVLMPGGSWITSGFFHPGQTRTEHPNTSGTAVAFGGVLARDYRIHRKLDYAILFLDDRLDSAQLGWMGVQWFNSPASYDGKPMTLEGYPRRDAVASDWLNTQCDASPFDDKSCGGWMYGMWLTMSNTYDGDELRHVIDTSQAQSGSAIRYNSNILGVHWGSKSSESFNRAARFRSSMWNDVCSWIALVPSAFGSHALCN